MPALQSHTPFLHTWHHYDPACKTDLWSTVVSLDGKTVIIDPAELDESGIAEIRALGIPVMILLTNGNHERHSARLASTLGVPSGSHPYAFSEFTHKPLMVLEPGAKLHGFVPVPVEGAAAGEIALHCPSKKLLIVGDAFINLEKTGFALLPDKYCLDPSALRTSARKLLDLDFDILAFAHGEPILKNAKSRLRELLSP
jgi:glyoxylase-like metal-dependent hydrolase (beta-lactamase superfamily II)